MLVGGVQVAPQVGAAGAICRPLLPHKRAANRHAIHLRERRHFVNMTPLSTAAR